MTLLTQMRLSVLVCLCGLMTARGQQQPARPASNVIEGIEFSGMRRVPQDTLRATIRSKVGDVFDEEASRRDLTALWNTKRFDDIVLTKEAGDRGGIILRFTVTERREQPLPALASNVIEGIEFSGVNRVSQDTLKAAILSRVGDVFDEETLRRDEAALWNTKRFDDITVKKETGDRGGIILRFVMTERP